MSNHALHYGADSRLAMMALILLIGLVAYWNSFEGKFILDDNEQILESTSIRSLWPLSNVVDGTRRPVTKLSLAANYALGGEGMFGYHLFNLVVHLAAGLVLFGLVSRTLRLGSLRLGFPHPGSLPFVSAKKADFFAFAVAAIWLVHPLQTESVTYITQRTESMMGLFYLLVLYCVLRGSQSSRPWFWYAAAVAACWLGMGTKEVMVTAPLVLLLYDRVFLAESWREIIRRRWGVYLGQLAAVLLLISAVIWMSSPERSKSAGFGYERITSAEYLATQGGVLLYYLRLVFWPNPLCLDYAWPIARTHLAIFLPCSLITGLFVASCAALRRHPPLGFLGLSFFLILAPTSSFMPIADLAFEHRMYLPLAPVVILTLLGFYTLAGRVLPNSYARNAVLSGTLIVVAMALMARTIDRNTNYQDPVAMWKNVLLTTSDKARAYNNLGNLVSKRGEVKLAIEYYNLSIKANADYALAYNNLGATFFKLGHDDEAIQYFARALGIDPKYAYAHNNLGSVLAKRGELNQASVHFEQAIANDPKYPDPHCNLGRVYATQMRPHQAVKHLREALGLKPDFLEAANLLAWLLAVSEDPTVRNGKEAVRWAERSAQMTLHKNPFVLDALAAAYAEAERWDEAVATAEQAVALASRAHRSDLARTFDARLRLYQHRQPYRDRHVNHLSR